MKWVLWNYDLLDKEQTFLFGSIVGIFLVILLAQVRKDTEKKPLCPWCERELPPR